MQSKKYSRKEYRRQHYLKNKKHTLAVNKLWAKNNIERKVNEKSLVYIFGRLFS